MTLSILLFILLRMNCRVLICAPTNVAITQVAMHVLKLVKESSEAGSLSESSLCSMGNILFMGSDDALEVASDIEEIYLNYRVQRVLEVLGPLKGLKHCSNSMIDFLEGCVSQYNIFLDSELRKEKEESFVKSYSKGQCKTFLEFVRERFGSIALELKRCISIFCTHIARSFIKDCNFEAMVSVNKLLDSFETLLSQNNIVCEELLNMKRGECIYILKSLQFALDELDLPSAMDTSSVKKFCFQTASLIFCTASSSSNLHSLDMKPLELLVIDDAAQLKECELAIPLQLPSLRHAILFGDHRQLPAIVNSNVSKYSLVIFLRYNMRIPKNCFNYLFLFFHFSMDFMVFVFWLLQQVSARAGFGRSLFERLSLMGHSKHFLNMQYTMHPLISSFPNSKFYGNKIMDAPTVRTNFLKRYLPGQIFGPYSFINVSCGKEELDGVHHSWKNMVEVAVIKKLVNNLYKGI
jgi:hypothetical protein